MRERERQKRERDPWNIQWPSLPLLNVVVPACDVGVMATTLGP